MNLGLTRTFFSVGLAAENGDQSLEALRSAPEIEISSELINKKIDVVDVININIQH